MKPKFNCHKFLAFTLITAPIFSSVLPAEARQAPTGKRSVRGGSWVELQASTNKLSYKVGEPIQVTLKATNIQEKDAYLKFTSSQRYDFQVFKIGEKEPVYTWSANKSFLMATETMKLKLAQRETYKTEIGDEMGELPPGKYRLQAHLTNSSQIRARAIDFTVEPRASASNGATNNGTRANLTATTDKRVYKIGEPIKVDFSLHNNSKTATTFNFQSGQNYDVFVKNAAGESIWNWSANVRFIMVSRPVTFAAGEKRDFSVEWNGQALPEHKVTPGTYTVQAVYTSDPEVLAQPVTIEIR